jgi:hypothetical protein
MTMVRDLANLLNEKHFSFPAIGLFFVFMLFTSPLFSMIITTSTQGFSQLVDDDSHYFIQRASAQEEEIAEDDDRGQTTTNTAILLSGKVLR